jgi:transcriptional regulator with XRE-family HTH domain
MSPDPSDEASPVAQTTSGRLSAMGAQVGAQVRRHRERRGLTAAELARRSGIGKASLSKIEAGRGNPTIETLYAIAFALRLPISDLLAEDQPLLGPVLQPGTPRRKGEVTRELLQRINAGHNTEIWRLRMPPSTRVEGIPHATGTIEHLLVAAGRLTASAGAESIDLRPGDLLSFRGDSTHRYETALVPADVTVVLVSPTLG